MLSLSTVRRVFCICRIFSGNIYICRQIRNLADVKSCWIFYNIFASLLKSEHFYDIILYIIIGRFLFSHDSAARSISQWKVISNNEFKIIIDICLRQTYCHRRISRRRYSRRSRRCDLCVCLQALVWPNNSSLWKRLRAHNRQRRAFICSSCMLCFTVG